ncbi:MAG: AraC family transcriptional regulator [Acetobacteraceae bacterium]
MPRNTRVEIFDGLASPVIALANDFADGHTLPPHQHRRSQLLHGAAGAPMITTTFGTWLVPPQRAVWIPGGVVHGVRMLGAVRSHSLFLEPKAAMGMPDRCQVVGLSPFMRTLMAEAVDLPVEHAPDSRAGALMALLLHEVRELPVLPLALPIPAHPALAERCRRFLVQPTPHATIDAWSTALGMSRRAFTRLFRRETGLGFAAWRQQACLVAALPRLIAGEAVTNVAISLHYDNPAAFTSMFKRVLGASPRLYLRLQG